MPSPYIATVTGSLHSSSGVAVHSVAGSPLTREVYEKLLKSFATNVAELRSCGAMISSRPEFYGKFSHENFGKFNENV